jgi:hypothetical protein
MPKSNWEGLNLRCHKSFESDLSARIINQPPYAGMPMAMNILAKNGIIQVDRTLEERLINDFGFAEMAF